VRFSRVIKLVAPGAAYGGVTQIHGCHRAKHGLKRNEIQKYFRKQSQERGQTIALVALTIVTLLAMAALAIDVVTLYVAKGESSARRCGRLGRSQGVCGFRCNQRSCQHQPTDLAENMATAGINGILPQNKVAGAAQP